MSVKPTRSLASRMDRRITFQRPVHDDAPDSAGSQAWEDVVTVAAEVRDALPSRSERSSDGFPTATRGSRIRMRFRDDITSDMRIIYGARVMQIVGPPAELGRREGLELVAEDYSSAGNRA